MKTDLVDLVTNLGDSAVLLPASVAVIAILWRLETARAAYLFARAMIVCLGAMFLLKIAFITCGERWEVGVISPSGHSALSVTVYGTIAAIAAAHARRWTGAVSATVAGSVVLAIASSRLALGVHTIREVGLGLTVGAVALGSFVLPYRILAHPRFNVWALMLPLSLCVIAAFGLRLPAEAAVHDMAVKLRSLVGEYCGAGREIARTAD